MHFEILKEEISLIEYFCCKIQFISSGRKSSIIWALFSSQWMALHLLCRCWKDRICHSTNRLFIIGESKPSFTHRICHVSNSDEFLIFILDRLYFFVIFICRCSFLMLKKENYFLVYLCLSLNCMLFYRNLTRWKKCQTGNFRLHNASDGLSAKIDPWRLRFDQHGHYTHKACHLFPRCRCGENFLL